jgi:hypothetical protein
MNLKGAFPPHQRGAFPPHRRGFGGSIGCISTLVRAILGRFDRVHIHPPYRIYHAMVSFPLNEKRRVLGSETATTFFQPESEVEK